MAKKSTVKQPVRGSSAEFPFQSSLDLSLLLQYWQSNLQGNNIFKGEAAKSILDMIKNAPELFEPIQDLSIIKKHQELVGLLMSAVFPPAAVDSDMTAAMVPFRFESLYETPAFSKVMNLREGFDNLQVNIPGNNMTAGKIMKACALILNKFHGTDIILDKPLIFVSKDEETGLERAYKVEINHTFTEVIAKREVEKLDKATIKLLLDNLFDCDIWLKYIRPEDYEFRGFIVMKLVDVTEQEMLSSIKYDLLKRDAVICGSSFKAIQQKLRSIFKLPKLKLGIAAFDPGNSAISNYGKDMWKSLVLGSKKELACSDYASSIYEAVYKTGNTVIVEDLQEVKHKTAVEETLIERNIRNVAIAPLKYDDKLIGVLELGTPYANKLNPISASKLDDVLPMFSAAIRRALDELNNEVRAVIQEECTAIHPVVEWKFMEAGVKLINDRRLKGNAMMEAVKFEDVYPIYGLADIRGSSNLRSKAIQEDLIDNLQLIKNTIVALLEHKKMPILDEINYRVDKEISKIEKGMVSGDETTVLDFISSEIIPMFGHFQRQDAALVPIIKKYKEALDPKLGIIYRKRKDYEDSLTMINEVISAYMDKAEEQAQDILPHYFEKYKTDGVEYNIYVGNALIQEKKFDEIHLKNLRLWQLMTMCDVARNVEALQPSLKKKMDIAQLALVQSQPLSIRFRQDEKKFDVDGAYNIRYEIVKKRIDKARIKDSSERLTQPGKIAIVYTQSREAEEYFKYIEYMQSIGYLTGELEQLELEELDGAKGLKALRITVNMDAHDKDYGDKLLKEIVETLKV
ncbi:MAG: GAF domain-containing protein [Bacteroidota bacterium]